MYQKKIILSDDGSHTIELVGMNEQYHSTHGAIQESNHVYIKHGLERIAVNKREISILEVGMGTGLNVLLSWMLAQKHDLKINYHSIEAFPIGEEIWSQLNYTQKLHQPNLQEIFNSIHSSPWSKKINLEDDFVFIKMEEPIQESILPENMFDVVYFDAFNPDLEPNLWTEEVFQKVYNSMKKNSILTTYSTKGMVKRALKSCGFKIEKKPGPIGKREILNALKIIT